jgi:hypothetical protein
MAQKPNYTIVGQRIGAPTIEDLIALTVHLTGTQPTPEEIARCTITLNEALAKFPK